MIKIIFLILLLNTRFLNAQTFEGCGTYVFKGILRADANTKNKMSYLIHEGTKSQMIFEIPNEQDLVDLAMMINTSSTFTGIIPKLMDGTKGIVINTSEISRRFPDLLNPNSTGITKVNSKKCD